MVIPFTAWVSVSHAVVSLGPPLLPLPLAQHYLAGLEALPQLQPVRFHANGPMLVDQASSARWLWSLDILAAFRVVIPENHGAQVGIFSDGLVGARLQVNRLKFGVFNGHFLFPV